MIIHFTDFIRIISDTGDSAEDSTGIYQYGCSRRIWRQSNSDRWKSPVW
ncbi:hypothetical protein MC7420_7800 [Coleofasciculus chthonoplastes PCC 7420]|uniref:Uncharacterized protein n=1 Tax=Coleofasciculus chthonoplastes PCC 7420 TaxID=118168 RepID=B4VIY0_9CYAN|nr:hypothetical protein MC7420_7800 [Coleofasciculus chthonoplastes PCC 7420]